METDDNCTDLKLRLGARIKAIRRGRDFPQDQLSELVDISPQTMRRTK